MSILAYDDYDHMHPHQGRCENTDMSRFQQQASLRICSDVPAGEMTCDKFLTVAYSV